MCNTNTSYCITIISQERRYGSISCMIVLPNGNVVTGRDKGSIQIWSLNTGKCKNNIEGHDVAISSLAVLPNGDLVSSADDNTVRMFKY